MTPTTQSSDDLKRHINQSLRLMRELREEIRVDLHLVGVEAKNRWHALDARGGAAEKLADDLSETTKTALKELVDAFKSFKASVSTATAAPVKPPEATSPPKPSMP